MRYELKDLPDKGLIKDFKDIQIGDVVVFPVSAHFLPNFKTQGSPTKSL
jgi:hypothetical protein